MKKIKSIRLSLSIVLILFAFLSAKGQDVVKKYDLYTLCTQNQFTIFNRKLSPFVDKDRRGISFSINADDGIAWLNGVDFSNGTIELDMKGKDVLQQSFIGIAFHGVNDSTFDAVYFRPFNFNAKDLTRKIHAVQYVSQPEFPWQVLREKFNGIYEKQIIPAPAANEWFHVRIVVESPLITVFVNNNNVPCLSVEKLNGRSSGKLGLWVGNGSDGDFSNLDLTFHK